MKLLGDEPAIVRLGDHGISELLNYINYDSIMVEIGCYKGESTCVWLSSNKIKTLYAIDPWENFYDSNDEASYKCDMLIVENIFDKNTMLYKNKLKKIKEKSLIAVNKFKDKSLDVVYIDGIHTKPGVYDDIKTWFPKVKDGGILAGHDYWDINNPCRQGIDLALNKSPDRVFSDSSWMVIV